MFFASYLKAKFLPHSIGIFTELGFTPSVDSMVSYDYLFKRAKTVLKTRYNIELTESRWATVEPFLNAQLVVILNKEKIQNEEIKYYLELLKRQNPTKFYLLELELIKEIRRDHKDNQAPTVRKVSEPQITITKESSDRDEESAGSSDFIYR